ncbi:MAG: hypothetical protein AAGB22_12705, partial [Bacteroidota bacterium]
GDLVVDMNNADFFDILMNSTSNITVGDDWTNSFLSSGVYAINQFSGSGVAVTDRFNYTSNSGSERMEIDMEGTATFTATDLFVSQSTATGDQTSGILLDSDAAMTISDSLHWIQSTEGFTDIYLNQAIDGSAADAQLTVNSLTIDKDGGDDIRILLAQDADITVTTNLVITADNLEADDPIIITLNNAAGVDINGLADIELNSASSVDIDFNHASSGNFDVAQSMRVANSADDTDFDFTGTGDLIVGTDLLFELSNSDIFDMDLTSTSNVTVGDDWINSVLSTTTMTLDVRESSGVAVTDRFSITTDAGTGLVEVDLDDDATFTSVDFIVNQNSGTSDVSSGIRIDEDASMTITDSLHWIQPTEGLTLLYLNQEVDGSGADAQLTVNSLTYDKDSGDDLLIRLNQDADITVATNLVIDADNMDTDDPVQFILDAASGIDVNGDVIIG